MRPETNSVEDPLLRQAVLDLFRANQDFSAAYHDFERTGNRARIDEAGVRIDMARERVTTVESFLKR